MERWLAWHRRAGELTPAEADLEAIRGAQRQAYDELNQAHSDHPSEIRKEAR